MTPRPHLSAAIVQLRLWVWMAAASLVLCAVSQLLVFGFVHYTDVRWTVLQNPVERVPAEVVRAQGAREVGKELAAEAAAAKAPDVNRVLNENDRRMNVGVQLASTAGVIAAVWLMVLTLLGVVVAASGSVPGIERAVTAAAWSIVLALLCLPLKDLLPALPWGGVFGSYPAMTAASEAARSGATGEVGLLIVYVLLPIVAVAGAVCVGVWFRTGVEQGMLPVTRQIDEALERELATVRHKGVTGAAVVGAPRAMSALNQTLDAGAPAPAKELKKAAGAESMALVDVEASNWRIGAPVAGSPEKRPI